MDDCEVQVQLTSNPRLLTAVRGLVRSFAAEFGVASERLDEVVLAVDEACSNSIRHAYHGRTDGTMNLTLQAKPDAIVVSLCDEGDPAAPDRVARKTVRTPRSDNVKPGRLGMQLIYEVFDQVDFEAAARGGKGNRLTMRLRVSRG